MTERDLFVQVAPDCPVDRSVVPAVRGDRKSIHVLQYELLTGHPYTLSLEDLIFEVHVRHKEIPKADWPEARAQLFSRPHPCMRASMLPKKYGWGVHHDAEGKIALHAMESAEYHRLCQADAGTTVVVAMRSRRA